MKLRTAGHHLINHSATGTRPSSCPPHARLARPPPDGFFSPSSDGGGDLGLRRRRRRKRATTSWTATAAYDLGGGGDGAGTHHCSAGVTIRGYPSLLSGSPEQWGVPRERRDRLPCQRVYQSDEQPTVGSGTRSAADQIRHPLRCAPGRLVPAAAPATVHGAPLVLPHRWRESGAQPRSVRAAPATHSVTGYFALESSIQVARLVIALGPGPRSWLVTLPIAVREDGWGLQQGECE